MLVFLELGETIDSQEETIEETFRWKS